VHDQPRARQDATPAHGAPGQREGILQERVEAPLRLGNHGVITKIAKGTSLQRMSVRSAGLLHRPLLSTRSKIGRKQRAGISLERGPPGPNPVQAWNALDRQ
jgi:hypothetical protein